MSESHPNSPSSQRWALSPVSMADFRWSSAQAHGVSTLPDYPHPCPALRLSSTWTPPLLKPTEPRTFLSCLLPGHSEKFNQRTVSFGTNRERSPASQIRPPNNISNNSNCIHPFTHPTCAVCQLCARQSARSWGYRHDPSPHGAYRLVGKITQVVKGHWDHIYENFGV